MKMEKIKLYLLPVCVVYLVALGIHSGYAAGDPNELKQNIRESTFIVDRSCTGIAITPTVIVTASHCVPGVNLPVRIEKMLNPGVTTKGQVIYDNVWKDIALIKWLDGYTQHAWGVPCPIRGSGKELWTYTYSLGMVGWDATLTYHGRFRQFYDFLDGVRDRWVTVFFGYAYPGASGAIVWDLDEGCPVGMITHGIPQASPPVVFGPDSWEIKMAHDRSEAGETK